MQTSQRGSVLLTIIGGIVILALLGMVAVSLMTGSVMTGLDAKETVQASYLAESGKEIVRVQTSKADTGARLMTLVDDTLDGKTFSITGGNVSLTLFPSWFRTSDTGTLLKGGSGWYPEAPSGMRELLLIAKSGTASRAEYSFGEAAALTPNADAYLIGRGTPTYPTKTQTTISVNTAKNDFDYFPETGGLIGVVNKGGATLNPDSAKRLIYERLSRQGTRPRAVYPRGQRSPNLQRCTGRAGVAYEREKFTAFGQWLRGIGRRRRTGNAGSVEPAQK